MAPINFFDGSLIRHTLFEGKRSLRTLPHYFGMEKSQQCHDRQQKQVKGASDKMRFNRGANVRFHLACASARKHLLLAARLSCRDKLTRFSSAFLLHRQSYGRGIGLGRGRGLGVARGTAVAVGVGVAVAVGVAVGSVGVEG